MLHVDTRAGTPGTPRHTRLFELIRRHNLAASAHNRTGAHQPGSAQPTVTAAHTTLTSAERLALGITPSFGR